LLEIELKAYFTLRQRRRVALSDSSRYGNAALGQGHQYISNSGNIDAPRSGWNFNPRTIKPITMEFAMWRMRRQSR
jgi:hypothetical protein